MLGPSATASHYIAIHQVSLLSHAACASMSTTTTRDGWDRYGPIEWAQSALVFYADILTQALVPAFCYCEMLIGNRT